MGINLTEAEIMEIVNLAITCNFMDRVNDLDDLMEQLQAIAKEYERRGKQRDKLLEGLKGAKDQIESEWGEGSCEDMEALIAECERQG